jgi:hypothetical protein
VHRSLARAVVFGALLASCGGGAGGTSASAGKESADGGAEAGGPCSSPSDVSPHACLQSKSCNPCTRISDAQATAAVGGLSLTSGQPSGGACEWDHDGASNIPTVIVQFDAAQDYATFESECHPSVAPPSGITVMPVSGVGDDACFVQIPAPPGWSLEFLEGCASYTVTILNVGQPAMLTDAQIQAYDRALALDAIPSL